MEVPELKRLAPGTNDIVTQVSKFPFSFSRSSPKSLNFSELLKVKPPFDGVEEALSHIS
jgi:hypothetical protein